MAVFPLFYAGNIAFYKAMINRGESVFLEYHENFPKQTFRSRMEITGPNGVQQLSIPTIKTGKRRTMKNVEIAYAENWQKDHWKGLEAAYRRSPYFEFYEHKIHPLYHHKTKLLWDLNLDIHRFFIEALQLDLPVMFTETYSEDVQTDFRGESFKQLVEPTTYMQVFSDRQAFSPNMSLFDALFNLGPQAKELLF
ncbi:MAG: WbqC family protein [Salibacteraceae bacterium]